MKNYDENKKSYHLKYLDVYNLYGTAMSLQLPVNGFKQVGNTSQCNKDFIKNYTKDSHERYFLEVGAQYSEKLHYLHNDLQFLLQKMKIEQVENLVANLHDKKEYLNKRFCINIQVE